MGGQVFPGLNKRINKEGFLKHSKFIRDNILRQIFNNSHIVQAYKNKGDFGDIDFIVNGPIKENWPKQLIEHEIFRDCLQKKHNPHSISILYKNIQLDFELVEHFNAAAYFGDYDPIGNACGRIARFFGCKYGHNGLFYPVYVENNTRHLGNITLTTDPRKISEFFGLLHDTRLKGFDNPEDIFEYIASSLFYSIECFKAENWDSATRTRNKKRKLFSQFIDYININHNYSKFNFHDKESKHLYLSYLNKYFKNVNLIDKINELENKYFWRKEVNAKFNGDDIARITGLKNKELGQVINGYKKSKDNYFEFLLYNEKDEIEADFEHYYKIIS